MKSWPKERMDAKKNSETEDKKKDSEKKSIRWDRVGPVPYIYPTPTYPIYRTYTIV